jgi:tetratricopeptide (TPR) repeat protein/tRNA A-37 threonylcarbamoyl transferase component Bud32
MPGAVTGGVTGGVNGPARRVRGDIVESLMDVGQAGPVYGGGRFEVRGTLGAGGAGVVYRAFDRQLGREVALKLLRQASGRDLYRFKKEFRALADIVHPNLVALHELHAAEGEWFFTMELVEGVSFIDWVRPSREIGPSRARQDIVASPVDYARLHGVLVQLVDALVALHRAGKLHRDLKPSNVLVTQTGRLALLDFGLVAGVAEGDPERLAVGTPVYMSPEQAADQPLGEASDWYSLGAMLYEALVGRRPFEGDSEQVMIRKQTEQPPSPRQLDSSVPAELSRLCMLLLQPSSAARPTGLAILETLGAVPSEVTRSIGRSYPPASFIGRTVEADVLRRALGDARRGGVAMLVRGRSGIGKTTLIRRFLRGLGDSVFVLEGRCFEREAVPFKMLDGVVDSLTGAIVGLPLQIAEQLVPRDLGSLVRLFPVLRRVPRFAELAAQSAVPPDPQEMRRRGFGALRAVLGRLARMKPLLIFFDDAHWGDADSAVFLAELIHGAEPGTLILIAHRPEDYLGVVAQIRRPPAGSARPGEVRELEIAPLSDAEATQLVGQLAGDTTRTTEVVAASGGNPLILTELARAPEITPGMRIDDLVRDRALKLSPDAQAMLAVSSIAARPLPVEIAAHAAGVIGGHDEATQLSVERLATLRQVGDQMILHPAHDHVRNAVLASLDAESRAGWHEALARAFEAVQGPEQLDSQAVVEHWLAAGHPANAAHHAVSAALRVEEAFAFRRAAELYEIALAYGPWDAAGQRDLLRRKAHALQCAGQLDEAAQVYGHAAQLLADGDAIDLERLCVEVLLRRGRLDEALPAAERLLAKVGIRIPLAGRTSRTRLATQWLQVKLRGLDYVERDAAAIPAQQLLTIDVLYSISSSLAFADPALGRVVQSELVRAALDAGEPVRVCLALAQEVCYAAAGGSRNRGVVEAVAARLKAVALRIAYPHIIGLADAAMGIAAHMSGRWSDARGHLEAGLATLRDHGAGVRWEIDIGDTFWLATLFYLGEWREMARLTQVLLREASDRGDVVAQQGLRTGRCNLAWLLIDRPDEAAAQLAMASQTLGEGFHLPHVQAIVAQVNLELYTGAVAAASRRLAEAWPSIEQIGVLRLQQPRIELQLLRARTLLADPGQPDRLRAARSIADDMLKEGAGWASGLAHLLRAAVFAWHDDGNAAIDELALAEDDLTACGMRGLLQVARLRRGRLEGGAGAIARAEAARDLLRDLGAADPDRVAAHMLPWPA